MPTFGHLPLILGPDKKRLSKRTGATSVEEFRSEGILPQALYNFLALLGWSPGGDREIMTRDEMIAAFSVDRLNASAAVFDREKLHWMNSQYLSAMDYQALEGALAAISGMRAVTLQPAAGAQGELTGILMVRAYHESRGDNERTEVIVPDSSHGTNPATASALAIASVSTLPNVSVRLA